MTEPSRLRRAARATLPHLVLGIATGTLVGAVEGAARLRGDGAPSVVGFGGGGCCGGSCGCG